MRSWSLDVDTSVLKPWSIVKGVRSFQEMLEAEDDVTSKAEELGLSKGMRLEDALKML